MATYTTTFHPQVIHNNADFLGTKYKENNFARQLKLIEFMPSAFMSITFK